MNEGRTISLCITTFNRMEWTLRSFEQVLYDPRLKEIIISDDCSEPSVYTKLEDAVGGMDNVKLFRTEKNLGCYHNKKRAIELASSEWVVILDSDNIIGPEYLDVIFEQYWDEKKIMAPQLGLPSLDYSAWTPLMFSSKNVAHYIDKGNFAMFLNTFNFCINRNEFLRIFDDSVEPWTSDSIYFCYCWLAGGNYIHCVPHLRYTHSIHPQSHYTLHNQKNPGFYNDVLMKLIYLR
jgi:glycosyltransferase involved in cell wall biosynthesis